MEQKLEIKDQELIKIKESQDAIEIKEALEDTLYVPDNRLKPKIIEELNNYLRPKFSKEGYPIRAFIAYYNSEICGSVICQVDPEYKSYSRKCGTFGWLSANNFEACKKLIKECELFIRANKVRKIRGNINFPKSLGGIGFQIRGFEEPLLYGVAYNSPNLKSIGYLKNLGYKVESEYTCVRVVQRAWKKGKKIDDDIIFRYTNLKGVIEKKEEIVNLAKNSFHEILPDASGRDDRFNEFIEAFKQIPKEFYKIKQEFNPKTYSNVPQFIDAWESCDVEKIEPLAPMAFDKRTGELVGILLGLPDLYQSWLGKPITRVNVDTAMVKKEYSGRGIFSGLNNIGQLTTNLNGIDYFEGTTIWSNNTRALDTIFPHCTPIRKHYVVQKRI